MIRKLQLACLSAAVFFVGCAATHQARDAETAGFLRNYSQLRPGEGDQALLAYKNPRADWPRYTKVIIDPVAIYTAKDADMRTDASREDRAALATYFTAALREELGKNFTIVQKPGPDVLRLRTALTDADQSEVLLDTVSTVMPIGLALSTMKRAAFGSGTGVGFAQAEAEILDSESSTRLAAAVDKRYGTKALRSKVFGSWNHAQQAMDHWSEQIADRLTEWGAGRRRD